MRTALVLNPGAGASVLARQKIAERNPETVLLQVLRDQGIEPEMYHTTLDDPGREIASQLATEQVELVIAAGGDGTIHAVAHGLIGSESILGILPAGTMNNLALSLGIPADLEEACTILTSGEVRTIDVGSINQHIFLEVAGIGLEDALFPAAEEMKSRGMLTAFRGIINGLRVLMQFQPPYMSVAFDGKRPLQTKCVT